LVAWPRRPCPRWCGKQLRRCCSTGPQVGRSNDPSFNQGSCRDSHRPRYDGTPPQQGHCEIATLTASRIVKEQYLVSRRPIPKRIRPPLR